MVQLILTILIYLIMVIPVGIYVYHIAAGKHTFADPVFDKIDGFIYEVPSGQYRTTFSGVYPIFRFKVLAHEKFHYYSIVTKYFHIACICNVV